MIRIKTWEVYKLALENPKAKFRRIKLNNAIYQFNNGVLEFSNGTKPNISEIVPRLDEEWEFVSVPVDFITAINSGKRIKSCTCAEFHSEEWYRIVAGLSLQEINGEWLIEDDTP